MAFAFNVAMYEQKNNKLAPSFDPQPYAVVAKKGRMVSVSSAPGLGKRTIRNASCFKRIPNTFVSKLGEPEFAEGEELIPNPKLVQNAIPATDCRKRQDSTKPLQNAFPVAENVPKPTISEQNASPVSKLTRLNKTRTG